MTARRLLLVLLGGALGSAGRLGIALVIPDVDGVPLATLAANLVGALLIGVLAARLPQTTDLRVLLGTGVLGGFTTYSALTVGTLELWTRQPLLAAAYAGGSLVLGLIAVSVGMRVARPRSEGAA